MLSPDCPVMQSLLRAIKLPSCAAVCRYYFWAVQQAEAGFVGVDGNAYPPRWQLREQTVSASHRLL